MPKSMKCGWRPAARRYDVLDYYYRHIKGRGSYWLVGGEGLIELPDSTSALFCYLMAEMENDA